MAVCEDCSTYRNAVTVCEFWYMIARRNHTLAYGPFKTREAAEAQLAKFRNLDDLVIVPMLNEHHM